jgi:hypothetical protein
MTALEVGEIHGLFAGKGFVEVEENTRERGVSSLIRRLW